MVPRDERPGAARRGGRGRATHGGHTGRRGAPGERGAPRAPGEGGAPRAPGERGGRGGRGLAAHADRLRELVSPVVGSLGFDLEDLSVSQAGRRSVLRVVVDSDLGVGLDAVAKLSREISAALDEAGSADGAFGAQSYTLEVTSPGVDRPLTEARHWRRNVGRLVTARIDETELTGRIKAADPPEADVAGVDLDVGGTVEHFGYGKIGPGKVQIEFARPDSGKSDGVPEPGKEEA